MDLEPFFKWIVDHSIAIGLLTNTLGMAGTLFYIHLTRRLVAESQQLRLSQTQPRLAVYLIPSSRSINLIHVVVANSGGSAIRDLRWTICADPKLLEDKVCNVVRKKTNRDYICLSGRIGQILEIENETTDVAALNLKRNGQFASCEVPTGIEELDRLPADSRESRDFDDHRIRANNLRTKITGIVTRLSNGHGRTKTPHDEARKSHCRYDCRHLPHTILQIYPKSPH